ncbi:MAG: diguanylate cyclase [Acidimicrobiaceae bacterium]|nr:diguanylate cyclase [Acidimicrobiaceae bacterium]
MRVLVADDDATSRVLLKAMVSKLGHDCLVASDGASAWELLRNNDIDVLLTEWKLPGMDGTELCRRVRGETTDIYTYVVIVSGLIDAEYVLEGMNAGADDYIVKPFNPLDIQTCLVAARRVTDLHRQLARVREQLEEANLELLGRSLTDSLTGLGNRRHMEEDLFNVHARALRSHYSYCVAMFDIDYFKSYNDRYGHQAGDEALRQVAKCLRRAVRAGENIYRYGGEEFLLVMPNSQVHEAVAAAERLLHAVKILAIAHEARPTPPQIMTLSAGVACHLADSKRTISDVIGHADRALYVAKHSGRNRVRAAESELS